MTVQPPFNRAVLDQDVEDFPLSTTAGDDYMSRIWNAAVAEIEADPRDITANSSADITTVDLLDLAQQVLNAYESYFKRCPRDKRGRCMPSQEAAASHHAARMILGSAKGKKLDASQGHELAQHLAKMTTWQLHQLKREHGIKASGNKDPLVQKLAARLKAKYGTEQQTPQPAKPKGTSHAKPTKRPAVGSGTGRTGDRGKPSRTGPAEAGGGVAPKTGGPGRSAGDTGGAHGGQSVSHRVAAAVPATLEAANKKIDRMANFLRSKGNHEAASWLDQLKAHVNAVGTKAALEQLGKDLGTGNAKLGTVHYEGKASDMSAFAEAYLNRHGIVPIAPGMPVAKDQRVISSNAPAYGPQSKTMAQKADFFPTNPTFKNKLVEAQHLPGLQKSEDINKLVGTQVTHLTPEVMKKLDETYGAGQWIVKTYGENAFAGQGIFFPQRAQQIPKDAQNAIWSSGQTLAKYGISHFRNPKTGQITGVKINTTGEVLPFGSKKYNQKLYGDALAAANQAREAAPNEKAAALPFKGKEFMAQPAFPVVGILDAERAAGVTFKTGQEGRVHIVTKNGKATIVPHSTWLKNEHIPVVFETPETKAMAQAALDAINALPKSERRGQVYAPDIVKTSAGYKVVEANPANETGSSGYLSDNPFIIDSYTSHLTNRAPAHVQFIRGLLTSRRGATGG